MLACGSSWRFTALRFLNLRQRIRLQPKPSGRRHPVDKEERARKRIALFRMLHCLMLKKKADDYHAARALPQEGDMDQILRYDRALQKKFDWALQKLLESQQRRRKAQAPVSVQVSGEQ
jgi:hypothetical protein